MRLPAMLKKELLCSRENISFHLVSLVSPLLFILAFTLMLSGGITFPLQVHGGSYSGAFETFLTTYSSPSGEAYFDITRSSGILDGAQMRNNVLDIRRDLVVADDKVTGDLVLQINDANENMTKNYRNRLHGALLEYVNDKQSYKLLIEEMPRYPRDIAWDEAFGVSVFAFGIALSGLLFGMLSMTHEWEDRTAVFIKLSPRSTCLFLLAKGISCLLKSFISAAAFMAVYFLLFRQMPTHGDILFLTVFLTAAVFIFLGMLIGHYIKSTITSFLLSMITALTVWIGGGGFGPLSYYGEVTNMLGKINPLTYTLEAVRFAYFSGAADSFSYLFVPGVFAVGGFMLLQVFFYNWRKREGVV